MKKKLRAEVTVFLSLLMITMLLFITALIESSTIHISKAYAREGAERAIESVFAEYHQKLLEEFGIFVIEGTYETGNDMLGQVLDRLTFYGTDSMEWEVTQLQLLSDEGGAAYEEQIIAYMSQKYGLDYLDGVLEDVEIWEVQQTEGITAIEELGASTDSLLEQMDDIVAQTDTQVVQENMELEMEGTALENVYQLQGVSILNLVVEDVDQLSNHSVTSATLVSQRELETGTNSYALESSGITNSILVKEYMLEFYQSASDSLNDAEESSLETGALQYELEYILQGKDSDIENLEGVVNQILLIRTGLNYTCLMQSVTKRAEVSTAALGIATASGMPVLQPVIEQALLLGWAYGESIVEVRSLLSGKKIPLMKTELDWQLSLSGLATLGTEEDAVEGQDIEGGVDYEEYLRILIYLEDKESVIWRGLDMLEQRMQVTYSLDYFQVDRCITQLELRNTSTVTGGLTYEFPVSFTYK